MEEDGVGRRQEPHPRKPEAPLSRFIFAMKGTDGPRNRTARVRFPGPDIRTPHVSAGVSAGPPRLSPSPAAGATD